MENRDMEKLMRDLIGEFDDEKGFYESVYDWYYAVVANSFKDDVEDSCTVVIFGVEYALSVQELYTYDSCLAVDLWRDYVSRAIEEDFHEWEERCIRDDIEAFAGEFQKWLSARNDERASDAIVALMCGDIDLTKIVMDWIYGRLCYEDWRYPA